MRPVALLTQGRQGQISPSSSLNHPHPSSDNGVKIARLQSFSLVPVDACGDGLTEGLGSCMQELRFEDCVVVALSETPRTGLSCILLTWPILDFFLCLVRVDGLAWGSVRI